MLSCTGRLQIRGIYFSAISIQHIIEANTDDRGKKMANNNITYTNLYSYMNSLLYQIQSAAGYGEQTDQTSRIPTAQKTGSRSFSETFKDTSRRLGVPESMDSIFEEAAQLYGVPLTLLKAVAKAESNFNASAVSAAGAQGVMQLMPATARSLGVDNPFDARSNIMGGAKYIAEKLNQYDGDIELALAAYNAGSGNVAKYGGVPPFTETRNYITRIKEYMGGDLTTGQMVQSQTYAEESEASGIPGVSDAMEITELTAQYLLSKMQLQMQDQMNSLSSSLAGEEEEKDSLL